MRHDDAPRDLAQVRRQNMRRQLLTLGVGFIVAGIAFAAALLGWRWLSIVAYFALAAVVAYGGYLVRSRPHWTE